MILLPRPSPLRFCVENPGVPPCSFNAAPPLSLGHASPEKQLTPGSTFPAAVGKQKNFCYTANVWLFNFARCESFGYVAAIPGDMQNIHIKRSYDLQLQS